LRQGDIISTVQVHAFTFQGPRECIRRQYTGCDDHRQQ